jgi:hypothetical protein
MSWRKCREISESEKKRDGIVLQSKRGAKKITISKKEEEEDRLRVTRKDTGTQEEEEEEDTEHAGTPSLLCLKKK